MSIILYYDTVSRLCSLKDQISLRQTHDKDLRHPKPKPNCVDCVGDGQGTMKAPLWVWRRAGARWAAVRTDVVAPEIRNGVVALPRDLLNFPPLLSRKSGRVGIFLNFLQCFKPKCIKVSQGKAPTLPDF